MMKLLQLCDNYLFSKYKIVSKFCGEVVIKPCDNSSKQPFCHKVEARL